MFVKISKSTYPLKAVRDTIYWLSKDYALELDDVGEHYIIRVLSDEPCSEFKKVFLQSLNDYALRGMIKKETDEIRNLIAAKAFYPDMVNFEAVGDFDDPVDIDKKNEKTKSSKKRI